MHHPFTALATVRGGAKRCCYVQLNAVSPRYIQCITLFTRTVETSITVVANLLTPVRLLGAFVNVKARVSVTAQPESRVTQTLVTAARVLATRVAVVGGVTGALVIINTDVGDEGVAGVAALAPVSRLVVALLGGRQVNAGLALEAGVVLTSIQLAFTVGASVGRFTDANSSFEVGVTFGQGSTVTVTLPATVTHRTHRDSDDHHW